MSDRVTWGDGAYAGFWMRVAARLIDLLLVGAVTFVLVLVLVFLLSLAVLSGTATGTGDPGLPGSTPDVGIALVLGLLAWLPDFLYDTIMTSRLGWTLGKRAVGIEVRRADGDLLSYGQAVGRYFGRLVSSIPFYLGFLWAAWDPRKQTWHDKMVNCFVVTTSRVTTGGGAAVPVERPWGGQTGWGIPGAARPSTPSQGYATSPPAGVQPEPGAGAGAGAGAGGGANAGAATGVGAAGVGAAGTGEVEDTDWARELSWDAGSHPGAGSGAHELGSEAPQPEPQVTPEPEVAPEPEPEVEPESSGAPEAPEPEPEPERMEPAPEPEVEPEPVGPERAEPEPMEPAADAPAAEAQQRSADDPNVVAVTRAGIARESAGWLEQVAAQVDSRLDRIAGQWRSMPHAEAARACAFGLLLGHLVTLYPHMGEDLSRVAEAHPSFSTLGTGDRLSTLQSIAREPGRAAAWLGPLVGVQDTEQIGRLLD